MDKKFIQIEVAVHIGFVMSEGASPSGNIASKCDGGNCKYNFADDTYTDLEMADLQSWGKIK